MAIYLVRHGQTDGNAALVIQQPDAALSGEGVRQAERLARRLAGEGITRILSSDYARAAATAECLREATGAELALDPLLRERHFGALRGTPYAELQVDLFAPDLVPPGGESWQDLHARVDEAWQRIRSEAAGGGHLAVVTHGLVCYSLVGRHWMLPPAQEAPRRFDNTALTIADAEPPHRVRLLNCIAHLEGPGPQAPEGRAQRAARPEAAQRGEAERSQTDRKRAHRARAQRGEAERSQTD